MGPHRSNLCYSRVNCNVNKTLALPYHQPLCHFRGLKFNLSEHQREKEDPGREKRPRGGASCFQEAVKCAVTNVSSVGEVTARFPTLLRLDGKQSTLRARARPTTQRHRGMAPAPAPAASLLSPPMSPRGLTHGCLCGGRQGAYWAPPRGPAAPCW